MNIKSCLIFAHRGANKEAAENTRSAFDRALCYAIDGMETDVQLSRDEVAVLWHDRFLGKVGLPDKHIDDFDFQQLQDMNFSLHFATTGHLATTGHFAAPGYVSTASKTEILMTLQQFLDAYRKRCRLLIEIKNRDWETRSRHEMKVRQCLDLIEARTSCPQASGQDARAPAIMVSSFNLDSLVYAQQQCPGFPLVYNFENYQTMADAQHVLTKYPFLHGLCLPIATLDDAMTKLLRDHDKSIAVYTCNSDEEINKALELKVDILITDVPQKALQIRDV